MVEIDKKIIAERIRLVRKAAGLNLKSFAIEIDVPYTTIQKYSNEISKPTAGLYIALFDYGVDLHWFISGQGNMFREGFGGKSVINYKGNGVAVHNNHGTVTTGSLKSVGDGRGSQICAWIEHYMETNGEDEQAWLDVEMARQFPEFKRWKEGKGE